LSQSLAALPLLAPRLKWNGEAELTTAAPGITVRTGKVGRLCNAVCSAAPPFHCDPAPVRSRRARVYELNSQLTA